MASDAETRQRAGLSIEDRIELHFAAQTLVRLTPELAGELDKQHWLVCRVARAAQRLAHDTPAERE